MAAGGSPSYDCLIIHLTHSLMLEIKLFWFFWRQGRVYCGLLQVCRIYAVIISFNPDYFLMMNYQSADTGSKGMNILNPP